MIDMLVHASMASYDLSKAPSPQNPGGGIGVSCARVQELLSSQYRVRRVSSLDDILADFVIVDPIWFWGDEAQVDAFIYRGFERVLLFGTDQSLIGMPHRLRRKLLESTTWITHNCEFQRNMYRACGVYHSQFLCAPVPERIFYPAQKQDRVIASGQVSWQKRTDLLIEVFRGLRQAGLETVYAGSATMWGDSDSAESLAERYQLEHELRQVTDVFLGNVTQSEFAFWSNTSRYHVQVAEHECCCANQQEAAMGGASLWGLSHPINAERPVMQVATVPELVESLLEIRSLDDGDSLGDAEVHAHAKHLWSYEAFLRQFQQIMREV